MNALYNNNMFQLGTVISPKYFSTLLISYSQYYSSNIRFLSLLRWSACVIYHVTLLQAGDHNDNVDLMLITSHFLKLLKYLKERDIIIGPI